MEKNAGRSLTSHLSSEAMRRRPERAYAAPPLSRTLLFVLVWAVVAVPSSLLVFMQSSTTTVIASHDAVVRPTLDGYATLDLGPYLPDLRHRLTTPIGATIDLGRTNVASYEALVQRYAFLASQPESQTAKLRDTLTAMAWRGAVSGALVGLVAPAVWAMIGLRRRTELVAQVNPRRLATLGVASAIALIAVLQPWSAAEEEFTQGTSWQSIGEALPGVPIPVEAQSIQVQGGLMTGGTQRLAESALDTYARSREFYSDVVKAVGSASMDLRQPADDETVAILVSDRHDNVGMDKVARAIADEGGATVLLDAGDDTSTGGEWEAFSLESLDLAFDDFDDRYSVTGNHDHGDFVSDYLAELGFTTLEGEAVDGPQGSRLLGVSDPRSSGLGTWRDEPDMSFDEHRAKLADLVCEHEADGDRISTLLVHDANSGDEALGRGCVDLVLGGHVHAQLGPTQVIGQNGKAGYTYTNGTTGGAAYALAIGSKLRRDAQVTLITYRDGGPVGIQPVTVRTVGDFRIGEYFELDLDQAAETAPTQRP